MKQLMKLLLITILVAPLSLLSQRQDGGGSILASAAGEEEAGDVMEGEEDGSVEEEGAAMIKEGEDEEESGDGSPMVKSHPDADTFFLFTKPVGMGNELPAGRDVQFLVGFSNKGSKDFIIDTMDASFRYAMDFSFHLQNFSATGYNRLVKPNQETTLAYSFFISDAYSARPYGLTVNMFYRDADGNPYGQAVFNETITIIEIDEGLDGETFFLYVFLIACVVLIFVGIQQFISSRTRSGPSKPKIERGTSNEDDVDFDWIPADTLKAINIKSKSVKQQQTPRQRRVKRGTGSADD